MDLSDPVVVEDSMKVDDDDCVVPMESDDAENRKDMKRVAEMVLVLSAMGNMRGGAASPTAAEKQMMAQARDKLIALCQPMAPKDIVPKDAVKVVIEDLGLNRVKDHRRTATSIKDKLQSANTKMEESKKFAMQSGVYSPQVLQGGLGAKSDNHGAYVPQRFPQDRSSHVVTGGSESSPSINHMNEGQSTMVSRRGFSSPFEKEASSLSFPRTEALHFRVDGGPNVPTYPSQVRASSPGDHMHGKTPTPKFQLGPVARVGVANKVPDHKVDGTPVMGVSQTAYGGPQAAQKPSLGMNFVHVASTNSNHNEIAKNVQKFLHPRLPERPSWNPPSTDYMNKSLTCQACKVSVNDVESLLVCDACEKGHHLKCLQSYNQKGIPKGEWHCPTCLMASNGKPLPPKYGRVTRNSTVPKASSNATAVQASAEKKVDSSDQNVNYQKATANGNSGYLHPAHVGQAGNIHVGATTVLKMSNPREVQAVNTSGNKVKMEGTPLSEPKLPKDTVLGAAVSSGKPNENSTQQFQSREASVPDRKPQPKCEPAEACLRKPSDAGIDSCHSPQDIGKHVLRKLAEVSSDHGQDHDHNMKTPDSRETSDCKPGFDVRKDGQDAAQTVSVGNVGVGHGARDCPKSSLDTLPSVDWIGDILQIVDEKAFYKSCYINGTVYKLQDHALFRSNNGNLRPSKLQALWEDTKTGSKWAIVNSCYFPADLPEVVGRPCSPENNEVYESNHGSTVRAALVQGPCEVLPPNKFKEESDRRLQTNNITQPVFLCKWFYDESKGLFRPVTD